MLRRPSLRRNTHQGPLEPNLVPMMDALVTMIAFLMYTMAFMNLSMVESPAPVTDPEQNIEQMKEDPLQLTVTLAKDKLILWSPFEKIEKTEIPNKADGSFDIFQLHEQLLSIKSKFPKETKIVLVPRSDHTYDQIIQVIDAAKNFEKTDPPITMTDETTGVSQQVKVLFSEVVFGNLLSPGGDE